MRTLGRILNGLNSNLVTDLERDSVHPMSGKTASWRSRVWEINFVSFFREMP